MMKSELKNKIIPVMMAIVSTAMLVAVVLWRIDSGRRREAEIRELNTVTFEVPGYGMKTKMVIPKKYYEIKIEKEDRPRFPDLKIVGRQNGIAIDVKAVRTVLLKEEIDKKRAEIESKLAEFNGEPEKGIMSGYAVMGDQGVETWLEVEKRAEELYQLKLTVRNARDVRRSREAFRSKEVQEILKSVRKLEFGSRDESGVVSDDREVVRLKRLPERIAGFKLVQRSSDSNMIVIDGKNGEERLRLEFYVAGWRKDLNKVVSEDYFVKSGEHNYQGRLDRLGLKGVATEKRLRDKIAEQLFFIEKESVVIRVTGNYPARNGAAFEQLLIEVVKNLEFDKERLAKFFS